MELLVDTSVWVDHLRKHDALLAEALADHRVAMHLHILGEIALGSLKNRRTVLSLLENLPQAPTATDQEVIPAAQTGHGIKRHLASQIVRG